MAHLPGTALLGHVRRPTAMSACLRPAPVITAPAFASAIVVVIIIVIAASPARPIAFFGNGDRRNGGPVVGIGGSGVLHGVVRGIVRGIVRCGLLERLSDPARDRFIGDRRRWRGERGNRDRSERRRRTATTRILPQLSHDLLSHVEQIHRRYTQRLRPERKLT
jgi:hypothetical protein